VFQIRNLTTGSRLGFEVTILPKGCAGLGRDLLQRGEEFGGKKRDPCMARQTGSRVSTCPLPPALIGDKGDGNGQGPHRGYAST
jgi:hypothetical protein